jgi:hypothetical protein
MDEVAKVVADDEAQNTTSYNLSLIVRVDRNHAPFFNSVA